MARGPSPELFVQVVAPAVRQAAAVARALEGRVRNRPKAGEASDVKAALTMADSAAQEAILVPLLEHFPGVALEAEEDTPSVASFPDRGVASVVIDPIDGTLRSYLEERGPYAVIVGLRVDDEFHASLVALPREGVFLDAVLGAGARKTRPRGKPRPIRAEPDGPRVLVSHGMPDAVLERLRAAGFEPAFACGGVVSVAPLLPGVRAGLRIAPPSSGTISPRGRAGLLIAREAGACVLTGDGLPFPTRSVEPARTLVVAADRGDAGALCEALGEA